MISMPHGAELRVADVVREARASAATQVAIRHGRGSSPTRSSTSARTGSRRRCSRPASGEGSRVALPRPDGARGRSSCCSRRARSAPCACRSTGGWPHAELTAVLEDAQPPAADRRRRLCRRSRSEIAASPVAAARADRRRGGTARLRALARARTTPSDPGGRGESGDTVLQMYTSGTTGVPKGVLTTHRNLAAAAETSPYWEFDSELGQPHAAADVPHRRHRLGVPRARGTARRRSSSASSSPERCSTCSSSERVTNAVFVPTMLQMLAAVPGAAERDYSALRSIAYGASPITTPVLKAALRTFRCSLFGDLRPDRDDGRRRPARPGGPRPGRPARAPAALGRPAVAVGRAAHRRPGDAARSCGPARSARCGCARRT